MKGVIEAGHIPVNKWAFKVLGAPPLTITEQSGIEDELEVAELPDRTVASGGNRKAIEFDLTMPEHHAVEQLYMEAWYKSSQDPVTPDYKRPATLIHYDIHGTAKRTWTILGVFPKKRGTADREMADEGQMASVVWTMSGDDIEPI